MDHPREYGENVASAHAVKRVPGSSPRIRGKSRRSHDVQHLNGIIPANTGKMRCAETSQRSRTDHPREYGENKHGCLMKYPSPGSSPRIRGKCGVCTRGEAGAGIIPANTGKIRGRHTPHACGPDHPREYGENQHRRFPRTPPQGSSPRIRGKFNVSEDPTGKKGIIPANTGKIMSMGNAEDMLRDHPREYGENAGLGLYVPGLDGSSPRIRGK